MLKTKRVDYKIVKKSWDNPDRVLIFHEPHKGTRVTCKHRFPISAGGGDLIDVVHCTDRHAVYVVYRNARYGYAGVERFDLDAESDGEAWSLFEQNHPEEIFGGNWETCSAAAIVRRISEYE